MKSHIAICILALGVETTVAFQAPPQRLTSAGNRPTALKSMNDLYGPGRGGSSRRDDDDMDADVKTTETYSPSGPPSSYSLSSPPPPKPSDSTQVFGGAFSGPSGPSGPPPSMRDSYQSQRLTPRFNDAPPAALRRQNVKAPYGNGPQGAEGFRDGRQTYDTTFAYQDMPRTAQPYNSPRAPMANYNSNNNNDYGMSDALNSLMREMEAEKVKPVKDYNRLKQLKSMYEHELSLDEDRKKLASELQIAEADENYDKCEDLQYQLQELSYQSQGGMGNQGQMRGQMQMYNGRGRQGYNNYQGGMSRGRQAALARGGAMNGYGYGMPLGYNGVSMYNGPYAPGYQGGGARRYMNRGYMNGYGYNGYRGGYNGYGGYYPYNAYGYGGYGGGYGFGGGGYGYGGYGYGGGYGGYGGYNGW